MVDGLSVGLLTVIVLAVFGYAFKRDITANLPSTQLMAMVFAVTLPLATEILYTLTGQSKDISWLIGNGAGLFLGYMLAHSVHRKPKQPTKRAVSSLTDGEPDTSATYYQEGEPYRQPPR